MSRKLMAFLVAGSMVAAASPAFAAKADRRERRQQDRIAQGVKSGELTPKETAHLERREQHIDNQIARDRAENGGKLTPGERRQINREENRTSRAIYRQKHDAQKR